MFHGLHLPIVIVVIVIIVVVLRWRRRQQLRAKHHLARNQRAVYLQRQWLDPVFELLVVGGVIWSDLQHGWLPWLALAIGVVIGLPLGAVRGRFMYVRSVGEGVKRKIVLERNAAEISIFAVLIAIKFGARAISASPTSAINLIAVGLLGIGVASSVGRVIYITMQHYRQPLSEPDAQ